MNLLADRILLANELERWDYYRLFHRNTEMKVTGQCRNENKKLKAGKHAHNWGLRRKGG